MNILDDAVLESSYGRLVVAYTKSLIERHGATDFFEKDVVKTAREFAKETLEQLNQDVAEAKELRRLEAANRPKEEITWAPEPGVDNRRGATWTAEERQALISGYRNGDSPDILGRRHMRTVTACLSQLCGTGLVEGDGRGYFDLASGEQVWP